MRIIFFSDIHGNQYAYQSFIHQAEVINPDLVVFGGDIFGYYYGQEQIINDLKQRNFIFLRGNHDQMFLDLINGKISEEYLVGRYGNSYLNVSSRISDNNVEFVKSFCTDYSLNVDGINLYFAHGSKEDPLNGRIYPDTSLSGHGEYEGINYAFLGHTHHQMVKQMGGCTIINPGSLGQQRDGKGCKFLVFDTQNRGFVFPIVQYDVGMLQNEINQKDTGAMRDRLVEVLHRKPQCITARKK